MIPKTEIKSFLRIARKHATVDAIDDGMEISTGLNLPEMACLIANLDEPRVRIEPLAWFLLTPGNASGELIADHHSTPEACAIAEEYYRTHPLA